MEKKGKKVVRLIYNLRNSSSSIKNDVMSQNTVLVPYMSRKALAGASEIN